MTTFSSTVKVTSAQGEDFGALATIEFVQPSVGIDVTLAGPTGIQFTEDAAGMMKVGATLYLTLSDQPPT
jgi:hypothetical protein